MYSGSSICSKLMIFALSVTNFCHFFPETAVLNVRCCEKIISIY